MSGRNLAAEIVEFKGRNSRGFGFLSQSLEFLKTTWLKTERNDQATPDFFLIRAVTILEVSARQEMATLIDHSEEFTDRAVEFSKNFKMDFATIRGVQGRAITLGDIVAHSVPVNSFGQILDYFETLLGKQLRPLLASAVDRWRTEIEKRPPEPIIPDFDSLAGRLSRLFKVRHILCHELPVRPVYSTDEVADFLDDAVRFSNAISWVLTFEKFGLVPLTQTSMNIAEGEKLQGKQEELDALLKVILGYVAKFDETRVKFEPDSTSWLSSLNDAQEKWTSYRKAQCDLVTYLNRGGTIRPLLWAGNAIRMTDARIKELQSWIDFESSR